MGNLTKSMRVLAAASAAALVMVFPFKGQSQENDGPDDMYFSLVENFAYAQAMRQPEVQASYRRLADPKLTEAQVAKGKQQMMQAASTAFRDVFANEAAVHLDMQAELMAKTPVLAATQNATLDQCIESEDMARSFELREQTLRFYDAQVDKGNYPGPKLRGMIPVVTAGAALSQYDTALRKACHRFYAE